MKTIICDMLGIRYPIFQGGMAWVGTWELASAVSEAGGLGIIGAGNAPGDWVRGQIRAIRARTGQPFAVNLMLMSPFLDEVVEVVLEERVPLVTTGGGNPGTLIPRFKEQGMKVIPVLSSVALARRLERLGVDAVVAEGWESGGHVGETATLPLVAQVVDALRIPVIAAGGIADGRGLVAALALGAQGVQMGTRFVCSVECVAHPKFKNKLLAVKDRATVCTGHSLGHPIRAIENKMVREFARLEKAGLSPQELEKLGEGKLKLGVIDGDLENGSLMAGQIAGLINDIKPVKAIIEDIVAEAEAIMARLAQSHLGVASVKR